MKKYVSFILFFLLVSEVLSQRNYITPEPQKITFPESKQNGFRLSKKTSLEVSGVDNSKNFIKNFVSFVNQETGFELNSKINKKSNIVLRITDQNLDLGKEGYRISILPKENLIVESNTETGLFYGIESLKQIIHFTKRKRDEESFTEFDVDVRVENIKDVKSQQNFNAANLTTAGYKNVNETGYFQGLEKVETKSLDVYNIMPVVIEDYPRFKYRGMMLDAVSYTHLTLPTILLV